MESRVLNEVVRNGHLAQSRVLEDLEHGVVGSLAAAVDQLALLEAGSFAGDSGEVEPHAGLGDIKSATLVGAEHGLDHLLQLVEVVRRLGVQLADEHLGAVVNVLEVGLDDQIVNGVLGLSLILILDRSAIAVTAIAVPPTYL